ncbi:MAG: AI-2E family transporter [Planctomycetaceae bacterium]
MTPPTLPTDPPPPAQPNFDRSPASWTAGEASLVVLALLALGTAITHLGPVLQPFLVAVFLFYAIQFGVRSLSQLGMRPWTATTSLIGLFLIGSILLAQFVYRESILFQKTWPRYEDRIVAFISAWSPSVPWLSAPLPASPPAGNARSSGTTPDSVPEPSGGPSLNRGDGIGSETTDNSETSRSELPELTPDLDPSRLRRKHPRPGIGQTPAGGDDHTETDVSVDTHRPSMPAELNPSPRTSLTDLFRISSKDVLNYVFAHGFDAVQMGVLVFFYLVFLFLGSRRMAERIQRAFPGERGVRVVSIGQGISESMERFMVVKTVVGLGMGIAAGLIMYLFGLDHWLLWAFLFFASNYITYIGSMAACVPPVVLAYLDLDSATTATILGTLIILNRIFWIDFVELKMSGKQLNLDSTLMFLWLSYWGWAWGVLGLILAYPMMAAVKITLQHVVGAQGWALLLSDE